LALLETRRTLYKFRTPIRILGSNPGVDDFCIFETKRFRGASPSQKLFVSAGRLQENVRISEMSRFRDPVKIIFVARKINRTKIGEEITGKMS
jgi:hypothetical protein